MIDAIICRIKYAEQKYEGKTLLTSKKGMELVQVGILIAIAIALGLIFKDKLTDFIEDVFGELNSSDFF